MTLAQEKTEEKARLRAKLRAARNALAPIQAEAAAQEVARRALAFVRQRAAAGAAVALYAALPGELDCFPILEALAEQNVSTLLPVAGVRATPLAFRLWRPGDPLAPGRFGLREPVATAPEMRPDIVLTPLLGFDRTGTRLGFGGGYYDSTLACLRESGPIAAGGLAFSCQQADRIPREQHDQGLDFVVTEKKIFDFKALSPAV